MSFEDQEFEKQIWHRPTIIEFAGMPKSGKTTILDIVAHRCRRAGLSVRSHHGGGSESHIDKSSRGELNLSIAAESVYFLLTESQRVYPQPLLLLIDRGVVDSYLFTKALFSQGLLDDAETFAVTSMLSLERVSRCLSAVFIFVTEPRLALEREATRKLSAAEGRVMNAVALANLRSCVFRCESELTDRFPNVSLVDTAGPDGRIEETMNLVWERIEPHIPNWTLQDKG